MFFATSSHQQTSRLSVDVSLSLIVLEGVQGD